ncbi:MAG TPA: DUF2220 family protein [Petrimonas sp.]|nr:DUF2220 family protein [Petrimonas sp.]
MNTLLESYEKSMLFSGKNQRNQSIYFRFSKKTIPEYFEDTSTIYDEIHQDLKTLESEGFIWIYWRNNRRDHIVEKVSLNLEKIAEAYAAAGRKKLQSEQDAFREYLRTWYGGDKVIRRFITWLEERIDAGLSIKAYVDIGNLKDVDDLLRGIQAVAGNGEECFIRELSMRLYGDSKKLERYKRKIENVITLFSPDKGRFAHVEDVFLECSVLKNPTIVMIKGDVNLLTERARVHLGDFHFGIGISSRDINSIGFEGETPIDKIITIENMTAFYRFKEEGALIIYLGGFHNEARRNLIQKAHQAFPEAKLMHWGDIDIGGFKIYLDLCRKTGLLFELMNMGADTLEAYRNYTKPLTKNDMAEIDRMLDDTWEISDAMTSIIKASLQWMRGNNRKLEQEIVSLPWEIMKERLI